MFATIVKISISYLTFAVWEDIFLRIVLALSKRLLINQ